MLSKLDQGLQYTLLMYQKQHLYALEVNLSFRRYAPAVFQELMVRVLDSCREFARPYIEDIIVVSANWVEQLGHLKKVLQALKEAGLTVNPTKCVWGGCHMLYLGHVVGSGHLTVPEARAKAMQDYIISGLVHLTSS